MTDLAGFDVVVEIAVPAITEALYETPLAVGAPGAWVKTLRPPFSQVQEVWLDPAEAQKPADQRKPPDFTFRLIVRDVQLVPEPPAIEEGPAGRLGRSAAAGFALVLHFWKSSLAAGRSTSTILLSMLEGTVTVPGLFSYRQVGDAHGVLTVALDPRRPAGSTSVAVELTPGSEDQIRRALGQSAVDSMRNNLRDAVAGQVAKLGTVDASQLTFPMHLRGEPTVAWVGADALGIFAAMVTDPSGGNPAAKHSTDFELDDDFAVVLSEASFHEYICQNVLRAKARELYRSQLVASYELYLRTTLGADDRGSGMRSRLGLEPASDPRFVSYVEYTGGYRAMAERYVDDVLRTPAGQQAVVEHTPAPCGTGSMVITVSRPAPWPDVDIEVQRLDLTPGGPDTLVLAAHVVVHFHLPISDWVFDVTLPVHVQADGYGQVLVVVRDEDLKAARDSVTRSNHDTNPGIVADEIDDQIPPDATIRALLPTAFPIPFPPTIDLRAFRVRPDAVLLLGKLRASPQYEAHIFFPHAWITVQPSQRGRARNQTVPYHFSGTSFGCPPGDFTFNETFTDYQFEIGVDGEDVALPLHVSEWTYEFGSRAGLDPRPGFGALGNGHPLAVVDTLAEIDAHTFFDAPPLDGHSGPHKIGYAIDLAPDGQHWTFASRGDDGQYSLRVTAIVTDASGQLFRPEAVFPVVGERCTPSQEWLDAKAACDRQFQTYLASVPPIVAGSHTRPGPVDPSDPYRGLRDAGQPGDVVLPVRVEPGQLRLANRVRE